MILFTPPLTIYYILYYNVIQNIAGEYDCRIEEKRKLNVIEDTVRGLKQLSISVGDELNMDVINGVIYLKKISGVRDGWLDHICPISAANEAEQMNGDFGYPDFSDDLGDAPQW